jgi:hypothetical protein
MRWQPVVCFQGPEQREELGRASRRPRVGVMRVSATRGRRASCEGACVGAAAHSDDDIEQVSSDGVGARCSAAALHSGTACYLEHASPVLPCPALPCPALRGAACDAHETACSSQAAHYDSDPSVAGGTAHRRSANVSSTSVRACALCALSAAAAALAAPTPPPPPPTTCSTEVESLKSSGYSHMGYWACSHGDPGTHTPTTCGARRGIVPTAKLRCRRGRDPVPPRSRRGFGQRVRTVALRRLESV